MNRWRKGDKREKETVGIRWEMVVRLVQVVFREVTMPVEIVWENMVLVSKVKGEYRVIGLP